MAAIALSKDLESPPFPTLTCKQSKTLLWVRATCPKRQEHATLSGPATSTATHVLLFCPKGNHGATPPQTLDQDVKYFAELVSCAAETYGRDQWGPTAVWMHVEDKWVITFKTTLSPRKCPLGSSLSSLSSLLRKPQCFHGWPGRLIWGKSMETRQFVSLAHFQHSPESCP